MIESDQEVQRKYMAKLLNEENTQDKDTHSEQVERPHHAFRNDEILKALRTTNKREVFGPKGFMMKIIMEDENLGVEWLTDLCNLMVTE